MESFNKDLEFGNDKVVTKVILETSFSKEIRILLKNGQMMKEHKAPFPIIVHVLEGAIDFGVSGNVSSLEKGDILTLAPNIPHDLKAKEDSIIRLSLSKFDDSKRVEKAATNS